MAKSNPAPDEGAEDATIVSAIADTEGEIFNEAMGDPDPDHDGDKSLEEMEDPVGEDPEEIETSEDDDGESEDPEAEEDEGEEEPQRDERQDARVPSFRLREQTERADALQRERDELRSRLDQLTGRVDAMSRQAPPQQQQRPEKPDPFADPEGHERWVTDNAIRQVQQQNFNAAMAEGLDEHGEEFKFAHDELAKLGPNNPEGVQVFNRMLASRDPVRVLMRWAEPRLSEFREQREQQALDQLAERSGLDRDTLERALAIASKATGTRPQQQQRQTRLMPSLNGAGGSGGVRTRMDPRGMDGSETAIFNDAFTPLR